VPSYRPWRRLPPIKVGAVATALAIGAAAFTAPSASAAASAANSRWRTVPGPAVAAGASANLTALAMAGPALGWAAGFTMANQNAPFEPLLASWNGRRWRTIPVSLGKGAAGRLDGLAAASASDAWAVGTTYPGPDSSQPLFLHWNGSQWARIAGASVPGFGYVMIYGVALRSATDAWAVGEAESAKAVLRPVIEHWDGRHWRLMANPRVPPMTALSSVTVAPDGEAWAVGTPLAAVGSGVILHWTKRAWVTAAAPVTGGSVLLDGVTAVGPGNVWAVGTASAHGGAYVPYALHWNGRRWASAAVPHPGEGGESWGFEAVTSTGHGDLIAVGSAGSATVGRALYGTWNGRGWSLSTGPHITQLNAVSFDGRGATWAVGSESTSDQTFRPVVEVSG
jgi:hypothetical protein